MKHAFVPLQSKFSHPAKAAWAFEILWELAKYRRLLDFDFFSDSERYPLELALFGLILFFNRVDFGGNFVDLLHFLWSKRGRFQRLEIFENLFGLAGADQNGRNAFLVEQPAQRERRKLTAFFLRQFVELAKLFDFGFGQIGLMQEAAVGTNAAVSGNAVEIAVGRLQPSSPAGRT